MMTVKEISELTGISARTLHYYDEIGLFTPTEKSDAGYRLYDDKALETLQQILFFREFDIPLKEIKAIMNNPALDKNQILQMQKKMLLAKKERMERLIASIDDILKGENKMDFTIISKTEVEEMFQAMIEHMPEDMKDLAVKEFGSTVDAFEVKEIVGEYGFAMKQFSQIKDEQEMMLAIAHSYREGVWKSKFLCLSVCSLFIFRQAASAAPKNG